MSYYNPNRYPYPMHRTRRPPADELERAYQRGLRNGRRPPRRRYYR